MSEETTLPENTQNEQVTQEEQVNTQNNEQVEGENQENVKEQVEDPRDNLIKGLQKGYTQTRQDLSDFRREIGELKDIFQKGSSKTEDYNFEANDDILTKADLVKFFQAQEAVKTKAEAERLAAEKAKEIEQQRINEMLDNQISDLKVEGVIKTKADEESLIKFAVDYGLPDLTKAAQLWTKVEIEKKTEAAKKQAKAEEAAKVGSSQKTVSQSQGVDYNSIRNTDWYDFN